MEVIFQIDFSLMMLLFLAALFAGFVDSIAGGGGMITIPALLMAGIPPVEVLGTNKLQSTFGSFSATFYFYKKNVISIKKNLSLVLFVFFASALGSLVVQFVDNTILAKGIPIFLFLFAVYFLFSPAVSDQERTPSVSQIMLMFLIAMIGFYDGFFGPGTGSFLLIALVVGGGMGLTKALGHAKMYNFTSNLSSVVMFAWLGNILWGVGLFMAVGQFLGAYLGSKMAFTYGAKVIKPLVVTVSCVVCAKLLYEQFM